MSFLFRPIPDQVRFDKAILRLALVGGRPIFHIMRISGTQAIDKALGLLTEIIADQGKSSIADIGRQLEIPAATTYRLVSALVRKNLLIAVGKGRHVAGYGLVQLGYSATLNPALQAIGQPIINRLARQSELVAHLGIFEHDMVTYLLRAGQISSSVFTEAGKQLEAYCSAIGKVLLASLLPEELSAYLQCGPFISFTPRTITDPADIADALQSVKKQGFARDVQEVADGLFCLAVGIQDTDGKVIAAISVSSNQPYDDEVHIINMLRQSAEEIYQAVFVKKCGLE